MDSIRSSLRGCRGAEIAAAIDAQNGEDFARSTIAEHICGKDGLYLSELVVARYNIAKLERLGLLVRTQDSPARWVVNLKSSTAQENSDG